MTLVQVIVADHTGQIQINWRGGSVINYHVHNVLLVFVLLTSKIGQGHPKDESYVCIEASVGMRKIKPAYELNLRLLRKV